MPSTPVDASPTRDVSAREVGLASLFGCVASTVMNWPLTSHVGSRIGQDLGDPVRTAWQLAWQGHAVLHAPHHLYEANAFWPLHHSFAFSDSLLGYLPASLIGTGPHAALVRYNLLFLFAYALCFAGAYLLARELGVGKLAAVVGGAAFAYAPFRLSQNGHLHVISSGGIPLALFLLIRGYRRRSPGTVLAGWAVTAWQLALGFTLGLQLAYLLAVLAGIAVVVWLRRGRPPLARSLAVTTGIGLVLCAGVAGYQARPVLQVAHDYPEAHRTQKEIKFYSAPPKAFLSAPAEDRLWGSITAPIRTTLNTPHEQQQFPGATILLLALAGLFAGTALPRRWRMGLGIGVLLVALLSLGFGFLNGDLSYRLLSNYAPGWDGVRTPGRLATLTSLGLALLAAAGAQRLIGAAADTVRGRATMAAVAPVALAVALAGAVMVEGRGSLRVPVVPPAPARQDTVPAPQMHLPTNAAFDRVYQLWSTNRFQPIFNGVATFLIHSQDSLRGKMAHFPDAKSVNALRRAGFRSVILHLTVERLPIPQKFVHPFPGNARRAASRSVAGLPLTRVRRHGYILYLLKPLRRTGG
jgi:hypothetical protein